MVGLVWMLWLLLKRSLPSAWQLYATSINLIDLIWTHRSNYADCHNSRPHIDTTTTVSHIEFVSAAFFFSLFISIRDEYTNFYHSTHNSVSVWAGFSSVFDENVPLNWRLTEVLRAIPISRNDWINSRFSQFFSWRFFFLRDQNSIDSMYHTHDRILIQTIQATPDEANGHSRATICFLSFNCAGRIDFCRELFLLFQA